MKYLAKKERALFSLPVEESSQVIELSANGSILLLKETLSQSDVWLMEKFDPQVVLN